MRPYTYWTIELYDQRNGIRGGGGLGVLAADTRRVAERLGLPLTLVTPFYPKEGHQKIVDGEVADEEREVNFTDFGFREVGKVKIKCNGGEAELTVVLKEFKTTKILALTEPNFGVLYGGESGGDHRLYQEVALGFGGYSALGLIGEKPAVMQLNEVATFFAALARLDELSANGMDFYEAVVYTRKHTLYTNHTLVQAAEATFSLDQFERFVFPNLKSRAVKKWLRDKFENGRIQLSAVTIEIAEYKNGVSKLHARVANYRDINGERVKFRAITNGIDIPYWILPDTVAFYKASRILDEKGLPADGFEGQVERINAGQIREIKRRGREFMNRVLARRADAKGKFLKFDEEQIVFSFKRRFVDYKRPWLPFTDVKRLRKILEENGADYVFAGRVHAGDERMRARLEEIFAKIEGDDYLREHVHYFPDYDEEMARVLSVGTNVAVNVPIVGLEACGTSWEKDVGNMNLLISTPDGGVADVSRENYLVVEGENETEEVENLYLRMEEAAKAWREDAKLEELMRKQLKVYLPIISGERMMKEYLEFLFKKF